MATLTLQVKYNCMSCKEARSSSGNGCKCGDLFPVLLAMSGEQICPNFEYDPTKEERREQSNSNEHYEQNELHRNSRTSQKVD